MATISGTTSIGGIGTLTRNTGFSFSGFSSVTENNPLIVHIYGEAAPRIISTSADYSFTDLVDVSNITIDRILYGGASVNPLVSFNAVTSIFTNAYSFAAPVAIYNGATVSPGSAEVSSSLGYSYIFYKNYTGQLIYNVSDYFTQGQQSQYISSYNDNNLKAKITSLSPKVLNAFSWWNKCAPRESSGITTHYSYIGLNKAFKFIGYGLGSVNSSGSTYIGYSLGASTATGLNVMAAAASYVMSIETPCKYITSTSYGQISPAIIDQFASKSLASTGAKISMYNGVSTSTPKTPTDSNVIISDWTTDNGKAVPNANVRSVSEGSFALNVSVPSSWNGNDKIKYAYFTYYTNAQYAQVGTDFASSLRSDTTGQITNLRYAIPAFTHYDSEYKAAWNFTYIAYSNSTIQLSQDVKNASSTSGTPITNIPWYINFGGATYSTLNSPYTWSIGVTGHVITLPKNIYATAPNSSFYPGDNNTISSYKYEQTGLYISGANINKTVSFGTTISLPAESKCTISPVTTWSTPNVNDNTALSNLTENSDVHAVAFALGDNISGKYKTYWGNASTEYNILPPWAHYAPVRYQSYSYLDYDDADYYFNGFKYALWNKTTNTLLAADYTYNDVRGTAAQNRLSAYITVSDSTEIGETSYAVIIPFAYSRIKYPDLTDRFNKCVKFTSTYTGEDGSSVENAYIKFNDKNTDSSNKTEYLSSVGKYIMYGASSTFTASIYNPSSSSQADNSEYIESVKIHAYTDNNTKFAGTATSSNKVANYTFTQRASAYTANIEVTTRAPKLKIITSKTGADTTGKLTVLRNVTFSFDNGVSCKTGATGTGSTNISRDTELKLSSVTIGDEQNQYLKCGSFNIYTYNYEGTNTDNKTYNTASNVAVSGKTFYDIELLPFYTANDKTTITVNKPAQINGMQPVFSFSYSTSKTYTGTAISGGATVSAYCTSFKITNNSVTVSPDQHDYCYINSLTAASGTTVLSTITDFNKDTDTAILTTSSNDIKNITITAGVQAYRMPLSFINSTDAKDYTVTINNTSLAKITSQNQKQKYSDIAYNDSFIINSINADDTKYEVKSVNLITYVHTTSLDDSTYTVKTLSDLTNVIGSAKSIYSFVNSVTISPLCEYMVQPVFEKAKEPDPVTITAAYISGVPYYIKTDNMTNSYYVSSADSSITSIKENDSTTIESVTPAYRYYELSNSSVIYKNDLGTETPQTNINLINYKIQKPSSMSNMLASVKITPAFNKKQTYKLIFNYSDTSYNFYINYNDDGTKGASVTSTNTNIISDAITDTQISINSIAVSNKSGYAVSKIMYKHGTQGTQKEASLPCDLTFSSNDIIIKPVIEQTTHIVNVTFNNNTDTDYTIKYYIGDNGSERSQVVSTDTKVIISASSTDTITITSITTANIVYVYNGFNIGEDTGSLNVKYALKEDMSITVLTKYDPSRKVYYLNVDAEQWTENVGDNFNYNVLLSNSYFKFNTSEQVTQQGVTVSSAVTSIDSSEYNNVSTLNLPVTYTGSGIPGNPSMKIMMSSASDYYYVTEVNYNPYVASYKDGADYHWSVPVSGAFERNDVKPEQYGMLVRAIKYKFSGVAVPYDTSVSREAADTTLASSFNVAVNAGTTFIPMASPSDAGIDANNYGILLKDTKIWYTDTQYAPCKCKLSVMTTTLPATKIYNEVIIGNNKGADTGFYASIIISLTNTDTGDASEPFGGELILSPGGSISMPYKAGSNITVTITVKQTAGDNISFNVYQNNDANVITSAQAGATAVTAPIELTEDISSFYIK